MTQENRDNAMAVIVIVAACVLLFAWFACPMLHGA